MRSAREQTNSIDQSYPKTSVWLFVMVLGVSTGVCVAAIEGEAELLKKTAIMIRENRGRIQHWQGSALIEDHQVDCNDTLLSRMNSRASFWASVDVNAVKWSMTYDDYRKRLKCTDPFYTGETGKAWDEMKKDDKFYCYKNYYTIKDGVREKGLTIWPYDKPRSYVYTTTFDPFWYFTNKGRDMCGRLLFFYDEADNPQITPKKIWQRGSYCVASDGIGQILRTCYSLADNIERICGHDKTEKVSSSRQG